jgi:hypothetical protein
MGDYGIHPPDEPLPAPLDHPDDSSDEWTDSDDETAGDRIFNHCLGIKPTASKTRHSIRTPQDYRARLEAERAAWKGQEEILVQAYMEWKVRGELMESEGDGMEWFTCSIFSLEGVQIFLRILRR